MTEPEKTRFVTIHELAEAVERLEQKVPSRWEVRTLILGAIVVTNYNLPPAFTTAAIAAAAVGLAGKIVSAFLLRT